MNAIAETDVEQVLSPGLPLGWQTAHDHSRPLVCIGADIFQINNK